MVCAIATDGGFSLDDGDGAATFDRLHGGSFATGAGADDHDIVFTRKFGHGDSPGKLIRDLHTNPQRQRGRTLQAGLLLNFREALALADASGESVGSLATFAN
ncbi:hypothetical protein LBMAG52_30860 [Planctomycetia bacterium]|nr:hypothetical protein LBMAG52_30860 [Planctomycetia bacterium]